MRADDPKDFRSVEATIRQRIENHLIMDIAAGRTGVPAPAAR